VGAVLWFGVRDGLMLQVLIMTPTKMGSILLDGAHYFDVYLVATNDLRRGALLTFSKLAKSETSGAALHQYSGHSIQIPKKRLLLLK